MPTKSHSNSEQTHLTSVAFLPPPELQTRLNGIRATHDRSYPRYTAHITLPYHEPGDIDAAITQLRSTLTLKPISPFEATLDRVGQFRGRHNVTVYLDPDEETARRMREAWRVLGVREDKGRPFAPHLTLGQAPHSNAPIELLTSKAKRVLTGGPLQWRVDGFVFLRKDVEDDGIMRPYAFVRFDGRDNGDVHPEHLLADPRVFPTYYFDGISQWVATPTVSPSLCSLQDFRIAVRDLATPSDANRRITDKPDVLVLHGVTDDALQKLLLSRHIRQRFTFCTHGTQSVLPAEHNTVVFSTQVFSWSPARASASHPPVLTLSADLTLAFLQRGDTDAVATLHKTHPHSLVVTETTTLLLHLPANFVEITTGGLSPRVFGTISAQARWSVASAPGDLLLSITTT